MQEVCRPGFKEFFFLNLMGILLAAAYYAVLVRTSITFTDHVPLLARSLLPVLACFQVYVRLERLL